jgi:hypothetical protein
MHVVTSRRAAATRTRTQRRREDARPSDRAIPVAFPWLGPLARGPGTGRTRHTSRLRRSQTATQTATDGPTQQDARSTLTARRHSPLLRHETADTRPSDLALTTRVYLLELH